MRLRTATALLALCIAGCGAAPAARVPDGRFTVTLDDYMLQPQAIRVPAGPLTVTIVNRGRIAHAFALRSGATATVLRMSAIKPGERASRSFRLAHGHYRMLCPIANHEELGMWGTLVVR